MVVESLTACYNSQNSPYIFPEGHTVNREYFVVKIISDSLACAIIKRTKCMRNINDNAVQGRLSENYLI